MTVMHAHKLILKVNAPILYEFCEKYEDKSPIPIIETSVEVFNHVLRFVYGGDVPKASLKDMGIYLYFFSTSYLVEETSHTSQ